MGEALAARSRPLVSLPDSAALVAHSDVQGICGRRVIIHCHDHEMAVRVFVGADIQVSRWIIVRACQQLRGGADEVAKLPHHVESFCDSQVSR